MALGDIPISMTVHQSIFSQADLKNFKRGEHNQLYRKFGAHQRRCSGQTGTHFAVWAPDVDRVDVVGSFRDIKQSVHPLRQVHARSGIWEGFIPAARTADRYIYRITSGKKQVWKIDPYGRHHTQPPDVRSTVAGESYQWQDDAWMKRRARHHKPDAPMSVYEVHLGSWRRQDGQFLTYRQLADKLPDYVDQMGFTHVEFLPVMEHPYYGSWGYQTTGYFAPTSRYGSLRDFKRLIDALHQRGIGVILDWVPSHFPVDEYGLSGFNHQPLYETAGLHPDWQTCIFNTGSLQVVDFLISNAMYWLEQFHADAIRVDAVASMLYLNYSRAQGEWDPNLFGGFENIEAVAFVRKLNDVIKRYFPDVLLIAEESTSWPGVSRDDDQGGLGFDMKWNLGWMHDTLQYFCEDEKKRDDHLKQLTFSLYYAFNENFLLPLSHDEVVHGKSSLLGKMNGEDQQKFANLRSLFAYMFAHPGKKLLFMGSELAPWNEWNHDAALPWELLNYDRHSGIQRLVRELNHIYRRESALHQLDFSADGFEWIDYRGRHRGVISFLRRSSKERSMILVVCNLKDRHRKQMKVGLPVGGCWKLLLDTDAVSYGGKGLIDDAPIRAKKKAYGKHKYHIQLTMAPLSVVYLKWVK